MTTLATAARNAACDAVVDLVDAGPAAGKLKIYDGAVLAVTIILPDPAFGAAVAGVATANGLPLSANATAAVPAADNFEVTDSTDVVVFTGTVTATGGGGDLELNSTNIALGRPVSVTSWTHTQPA